LSLLNYSIQPISLSKVRVNDHFWAARIKTNHEITIPHVFRQCEDTGRINNFLRAGGLLNDGKKPIFPHDDSDVYKAIEGAAYSLILNPDSKLEGYIDDLIDKITYAQEKDGYLYTARTISPDKPHIWAGDKRWDLVSVFSHELYNLGHLIESAIAYYQATGKKKFLNMAIKGAELIENDFGFNKIERFAGHQEIELALIKLYELTNEKRYLDLAKFFLEIRGSKDSSDYNNYLIKFNSQFPFPLAKNLQYNQSHKRFVDQDEAVGHTVRALYMYSAVTDIVALSKDKEYESSINRLWENVVSKKLYITGGIGARSFAYGESFWDDYKLPNFDSYNETCAAIGNIFWNRRLFLLYGDTKYIDVLERILYNAFLVGNSLDGKSFFYSNSLASKGKLSRKPWFRVPCCPTNIIRLFPQIPSLIYGKREKIIFINLFIGSSAIIKLDDSNISINQETNYPWEGYIKFIIRVPQKMEFTLAIRIPGWARDKPVPSNLYYYLKKEKIETKVKINRKLVDFHIEKGFAIIQHMWKDNDIIEINIPMPIRRVLSNKKVEDNAGKVAIERGPIVYCIESVDNNVESIFNISLSDNAKFDNADYRNIIDGIFISSGDINFIPYYAWANRGNSEMAVWIKRGDII
jgi:DUF1680 family protein